MFNPDFLLEASEHEETERKRINPLPLLPQHSHESEGSATVFTLKPQHGKMESKPLLLLSLLASMLSRFEGFLWHLSRGHNCTSPAKEENLPIPAQPSVPTPLP